MTIGPSGKPLALAMGSSETVNLVPEPLARYCVKYGCGSGEAGIQIPLLPNPRTSHRVGDEERKAAMVSNLMVVLCGDQPPSPVVNTGSLYT